MFWTWLGWAYQSLNYGFGSNVDPTTGCDWWYCH